jgi:2-dehydro-3-deoxygalactonokinase
MAASAGLIGVDWGTTSLRAYLLAPNGTVLDRKQSQDGILAASVRGFGHVFRETIGPWSRPEQPLPVLMSGMIGSRQGWVEAPYLACPTDISAIAIRLLAVEPAQTGLAKQASVRIVPGLSFRDAAGVPDVMRGEETQIIGALADGEASSGLLVLPGTHSKWAKVEGGRIVSFATYMTGEVYAALKDHTILGRMMDGGGHAPEAFARGVRAAAAQSGPPGAILHQIFSARTLALFEQLASKDVAAYLSGLLIGAEIVAAAPSGSDITIIAGAELASHYASAAAQLGISARLAPADCVAAGHIAIARAAQLI